MGRLLELWQNKHRPHLHQAACWIPRAASLTYVPTGAGFTGVPPPSHADSEQQHPLFHPDQLDRFGATLRILAAGEDVQQLKVWEEVIVEGAVHQGQWDWLVPGQPATRRLFTLPMALSAQYTAEGLLQEVKVWWDQASLLAQLGVTIQLASGKQCAQRLVHPNPNNANFLLKAIQESSMVEVKPIAVQAISPRSHVPHKALTSTVFQQDQEPEQNSPSKPVSKITLSTLQLTYEPLAAETVMRPTAMAPAPDILPMATADPVALPSIAVDPRKFNSKVFAAPSPYKPTMAYRSDRFQSSIPLQDDDDEVIVGNRKFEKLHKKEEAEAIIDYRPSVKINQAHLKSQFTIGFE